MTHVRQTLVSLNAAIQLLPRESAKLAGISASARAVNDLGAAEAVAKQPTEAALDAVRRRITLAYAAGTPASQSDLRDAVWLLWAEKQPLAQLDGLVDAIWQLAFTSNATARGLIEAWLRGFSQNDASIGRAGAAIRQLLLIKPTARLDNWRRVDRKIELFEPSRGVRNLARWLVHGPEPVDEVLAVTGFSDPLRAAGGFLRSVQRDVVAIASDGLFKDDGTQLLDRIFRFLAPDGTLRFAEPKLRGELARGLLQPWLGSERQPSEDIRVLIQSFLLEHLDDPRLKPLRWQGAGEQATSLMRRWLTRASLRAFFGLISDHALDAHWRYREAFWSACLEKSPAMEAWLALGSRVHASARAVEDLRGAYARLEGAGGDQAVLLLRVKNLIFCEWSHNGSLRAWPQEWPNAPKLGDKIYTRSSLMGKGLPFPPDPRFGTRGAADGMGLRHVGSDRGTWQASAAELLARRAQIVLLPSEWMPR